MSSRRLVFVLIPLLVALAIFLIFNTSWHHDHHQVLTSPSSTTKFQNRDSERDENSNSKDQDHIVIKHEHEDDVNDERSTKSSLSVLSSSSSSSSSSKQRFSHESERLHIAMISHGWNAPAAKKYFNPNTIKGPHLSLRLTVAGILKYTSNPVSLYFVVGEDDKPSINEMMRPIKYWRQSLEWSFVMLDEKKLDEWMDFIGHHPSHRTGMAGNIKFFYPLVFPKLDKLLMLDTDVLIQHDMKDLWMHFHRFEKKQLYAMAPQWQGSVHPTKDNQFNAGVMLLRLDRMRAANWLQLAKDSIDHWHAKGFSPRCCAHGDQTVFHMIRVFRKGALGLSSGSHIPRHWNVNKCHGYQGLKDRGEHLPKHMPYVGLVHLGCCKMCTKAKIGPRWAAVVDVLNGTKFEDEFGQKSEENDEKVKYVN